MHKEIGFKVNVLSKWTETAEGSQVRQFLAFLEIILLLHRHPPPALRSWAVWRGQEKSGNT